MQYDTSSLFSREIAEIHSPLSCWVVTMIPLSNSFYNESVTDALGAHVPGGLCRKFNIDIHDRSDFLPGFLRWFRVPPMEKRLASSIRLRGSRRVFLYVFVAVPICGGAYPLRGLYTIQLSFQSVSKQQSCYWNMWSTEAHIIFVQVRFDRLPPMVGLVDIITNQ